MKIQVSLKKDGYNGISGHSKCPRCSCIFHNYSIFGDTPQYSYCDKCKLVLQNNRINKKFIERKNKIDKIIKNTKI